MGLSRYNRSSGVQMAWDQTQQVSHCQTLDIPLMFIKDFDPEITVNGGANSLAHPELDSMQHESGIAPSADQSLEFATPQHESV
ncbi:hypothetical protein ANCDUO_21137 [Ancylostoma duodenale]|uniref:Uncharacterized protein n=1 Tax=Ancylostoma duodenale TaxID=51022 RepID=A0A0C2FJL6_9BILA|nr:hypothetical protein ANCDUO_21137 [Ancylostoma duodenale]